jgi:hypothetical protein
MYTKKYKVFSGRDRWLNMLRNLQDLNDIPQNRGFHQPIENSSGGVYEDTF